MCCRSLNPNAPSCDQTLKGPRIAAVEQGRAMHRKIFGSASAVVFAASIAGVVTILPSFSDKVVASAPFHDGKAERQDVRPLASACPEQAWPYYDASCVRDQRATARPVKTIRIIPMDRIGR